MAGRELPIACSLGAGELSARLDAMRAVGAEGCLHSSIAGRTAVLTFRASVRGRVGEIVAAEAECCAFLDMSLREPVAGEVELTIVAPAGAEVVLHELVDALAGPRASTHDLEPRHTSEPPATVSAPKAQ